MNKFKKHIVQDGIAEVYLEVYRNKACYIVATSTYKKLYTLDIPDQVNKIRYVIEDIVKNVNYDKIELYKSIHRSAFDFTDIAKEIEFVNPDPYKQDEDNYYYDLLAEEVINYLDHKHHYSQILDYFAEPIEGIPEGFCEKQ